MAKLILILLVFVTISTTAADCKRGYNESCNTSNLHWIIFILALINLLLTVAVIILGLLLYKNRKMKHKVEYCIPHKKINANEYVRQDSDILISDTFRAQIQKNESVISIISENFNEERKHNGKNLENIKENTNKEHNKEHNKEFSPVTAPSTLRPKRALEPVINREQMDALVRDILQKAKRVDTHSLSDLNRLITEGRKTYQKSDQTDKSSDIVQYDTLPSPVPLEDNENVEPDILYDVITNNREVKMNVIVSEEDYVMPITLNDNNIQVTDYVNARSSPKSTKSNKKQIEDDKQENSSTSENNTKDENK